MTEEQYWNYRRMAAKEEEKRELESNERRAQQHRELFDPVYQEQIQKMKQQTFKIFWAATH